MATIIPFPQQQQHVYVVDRCAGCKEPLQDTYWEIDIPQGQHTVEHIALCDECNSELMKHGVSL